MDSKMNNNPIVEDEEITVENSLSVTEERRPRGQKRRCGVYLVKTMMEDGKSSRILQILDAPVNFAEHPEFVQGLNTFRNETYGDEGKLYITKDAPIPEENPEIVVHFAFIRVSDGKISGEKLFNKNEAREHMKKLREEIKAYRERRYSESNPAGFGTNVNEVIKKAASNKALKENAAKVAASN